MKHLSKKLFNINHLPPTDRRNYKKIALSVSDHSKHASNIYLVSKPNGDYHFATNPDHPTPRTAIGKAHDDFDKHVNNMHRVRHHYMD